ncbi:MAG: helix-turn-helix domain-containing protein [Sulfurovum sp.]
METFFTTSDKIHNIIKSFNLTKRLFVSSIIIGEANTGKKSLAKYIFPNAFVVSGESQKEVENALHDYDEIIITNFEKLSNQNALNFNNKRIIATANYIGNSMTIDDIFAFIYNIPPLIERPKDIEYIKDIFINEAKSTLMLEEVKIDTKEIPIDLSENSKSMKKSIYLYLLKLYMNSDEIEGIIYYYIEKNLDGNDGYKKYLGLYEKPLIKAGLAKFGSQLQLSQVLGINRNTLRKKIYEYDIN